MRKWTRGLLEDLSDDRRAGKAGLPADDRDVTNGLVVPDPNPEWAGRPNCVRHGAMNRVDPHEQLYRCQMCGVGARWVPYDDHDILGTSCRRCGQPAEGLTWPCYGPPATARSAS